MLDKLAEFNPSLARTVPLIAQALDVDPERLAAILVGIHIAGAASVSPAADAPNAMVG